MFLGGREEGSGCVWAMLPRGVHAAGLVPYWDERSGRFGEGLFSR